MCTVAMCIETNLVLHLPLNTLSFYLFVFGATLVQYNLHYAVKKTAIINSSRLAWSQNNRPVHYFLIAIGCILVVISLFTFHLHHFIFLSAMGLITLLYSVPVLPFAQKKRIKDHGILKIFTLVLLWAIVTAWFPVEQYVGWHFAFLLVFARRFIFIFILCLMFDIRDTAIDAMENRQTIPVIIGVKKAYALAYLLLVIFLLLSVAALVNDGNFVHFNAMFLSAAATFVMIRFSKKYNTDFVYLACIDGMMLLQASLVIIGSL